ncbi:glycosyltransferase [Hymenobacter crusticola]|uniref:Mannosyl transferase n=1 Tax=Hymenobacter crusticola TaxID=1770526 RepID=A0A243WJK1_9BACT|nr:glycosyltransferase [Hymenobacter crusticola]OUJ76068.1 mannosyl transferase [Hymenobacter crusticola]
MNIVFFAHPDFLEHQSMPRFTRMLADGMQERGHAVQVWAPQPICSRLPVPGSLKKWLGYVDQYVLFPFKVRQRLKQTPADTLYVFTDHALGPWVPLVADKAHVVHCHDFLAQRSALGEIPDNATSWSGRVYQRYIHRGYAQGKHFISVSYRTREDLQTFVPAPLTSKVVYNGLNQKFKPKEPVEARMQLGARLQLDLAGGYLLHVGGNAWYKNRLGVVELYDAWRATTTSRLPLLLIGETPSQALQEKRLASAFRDDIHFFSGVEDTYVQLAYAGATVFLFPSLAEGFGWPIAEAMASGCPVITTDEVPMTEVAGGAGFLIPRRPHEAAKVEAWAQQGARTLEQVVGLTAEERKDAVAAGIRSAQRFDPVVTINTIEATYKTIVEGPKNGTIPLDKHAMKASPNAYQPNS